MEILIILLLVLNLGINQLVTATSMLSSLWSYRKGDLLRFNCQGKDKGMAEATKINDTLYALTQKAKNKNSGLAGYYRMLKAVIEAQSKVGNTVRVETLLKVTKYCSSIIEFIADTNIPHPFCDNEEVWKKICPEQHGESVGIVRACESIKAKAKKRDGEKAEKEPKKLVKEDGNQVKVEIKKEEQDTKNGISQTPEEPSNIPPPPPLSEGFFDMPPPPPPPSEEFFGMPPPPPPPPPGGLGTGLGFKATGPKRVVMGNLTAENLNSVTGTIFGAHKTNKVCEKTSELILNEFTREVGQKSTSPSKLTQEGKTKTPTDPFIPILEFLPPKQEQSMTMALVNINNKLVGQQNKGSMADICSRIIEAFKNPKSLKAIDSRIIEAIDPTGYETQLQEKLAEVALLKTSNKTKSSEKMSKKRLQIVAQELFADYALKYQGKNKKWPLSLGTTWILASYSDPTFHHYYSSLITKQRLYVELDEVETRVKQLKAALEKMHNWPKLQDALIKARDIIGHMMSNYSRIKASQIDSLTLPSLLSFCEIKNPNKWTLARVLVAELADDQLDSFAEILPFLDAAKTIELDKISKKINDLKTELGLIRNKINPLLICFTKDKGSDEFLLSTCDEIKNDKVLKQFLEKYSVRFEQMESTIVKVIGAQDDIINFTKALRDDLGDQPLFYQPTNQSIPNDFKELIKNINTLSKPKAPKIQEIGRKSIYLDSMEEARLTPQFVIALMHEFLSCLVEAHLEIAKKSGTGPKKKGIPVK